MKYTILFLMQQFVKSDSPELNMWIAHLLWNLNTKQSIRCAKIIEDYENQSTFNKSKIVRGIKYGTKI